MGARVDGRVSEKLLFLVVSVVVALLAWSIVRYWLVSIPFVDNYIHIIDVLVVLVTGAVGTITLVRLVAPPIAARAGPTHKYGEVAVSTRGSVAHNHRVDFPVRSHWH